MGLQVVLRDGVFNEGAGVVQINCGGMCIGTRSPPRLLWQGLHGGLGVVLVLVKQEGVRWWVWEQAHCGQLVQGR